MCQALIFPMVTLFNPLITLGSTASLLPAHFTDEDTEIQKG